jgi:hypothetical protein
MACLRGPVNVGAEKKLVFTWQFPNRQSVRQGDNKKGRFPKGKRPEMLDNVRKTGSAAAGAAGGAFLLHAREHEALAFGEIDGRVREHLVRAVLQKHLQSALLKGHVARLGGFGYVHSQRGASAAGHEEYPNPVARCTLLGDHFLELCYCTVCNTYHSFLLEVNQRRTLIDVDY